MSTFLYRVTTFRIMDKKFLLPFLSFIFLLIIPVISFAQVTETDCFSYYEFQTGVTFDNFHTDKISYNAGDNVLMSYTLSSDMAAPIVQGSVILRVYYDDNGVENIVNQFVAAKDIYLLKGGTSNQAFKFQIPSDAKPGEYKIKAFFTVANKFNLAGINFLDSVPGIETTFTVANSGNYNFIHFDKSSTFVNDRKYEFTGFTTIDEPNTPLTIKTGILKEGSLGQSSLDVTIRTYRWDDSLQSNEITDLRKTISLSLVSGQSQNIDYQISGLSPDSYLVVLSAQTKDGQTVSIMKIRWSITGVKGRFLYLGLDKFPAMQGKPVTAFFCLATSSDYATTFNGTGSIEILDEDRNSIFKKDYGPVEVFPSPPQGWKVDFNPSKSYTKLFERATLKDENGTTLDTVELLYDYSKFAGVQRTLSITSGNGSPGSDLKYNVRYTDANGGPLSGNMIVYLVDSSDKLLASSQVNVSGSYSGNLKIPTSVSIGGYTLKVQEMQFNLNAQTQVGIEQSFFVYYLIAGIAALIVAVVLVLKLAKRI